MVREACHASLGFEFRYRLDECEYLARVGGPHPFNPAEGGVLAILPTFQSFLICLEHSGGGEIQIMEMDRGCLGHRIFQWGGGWTRGLRTSLSPLMEAGSRMHETSIQGGS